jgi:hypothetical protein
VIDMDLNLNLSKNLKQIISAFILIILPWIVIGISVSIGVELAWAYILLILWFGMGFIFFAALN